MGGTRGVDELHHREVLLRGEAELGVEEVHDALPQSRASYASRSAPSPVLCRNHRILSAEPRSSKFEGGASTSILESFSRYGKALTVCGPFHETRDLPLDMFGCHNNDKEGREASCKI